MAGILPDRVREHYALPDDAVPATALAIGRAKESGDEALRERDAGPRSRKALGEFLFGNAWGEPSELAG